MAEINCSLIFLTWWNENGTSSFNKEIGKRCLTPSFSLLLKKSHLQSKKTSSGKTSNGMCFSCNLINYLELGAYDRTSIVCWLSKQSN